MKKGILLSRQLLKSTAVVSSMTLISRILGFVRDMLIARLFGVDIATDAFFVAFKIPNFFRRLFAEGAFAHAFVPIIANYREQGSNLDTQPFIDKVAGTIALFLLGLSVLGVLLAPVIILIIAPGFALQGSQFELACLLLKICLPYLFFIGLVALAGGILNAYGQFLVPALTPVFLNICMIIAAIWWAPLMSQPVEALAWGVFAAGLVQLLFQVPSLLRLGLLPRFKWGYSDPEVKKMLRLLGPAIFSVSVTQINLLLDTLIASFLTVGSVSWLYYSDRLVEFPVGLLGLALGTVILPRLAKSFASKAQDNFSNTLDWGLRLVLLLGMPATIGLVVLAEPMISTLFQYKEFSLQDVHNSALSLKAYAAGLLGYIAIRILVSGFTSRQDMQTPLRYGLWSMGLSLVLDMILVFPLAHAGLALATSLGALVNALLLLVKLYKDKIYCPVLGWVRFFVRIFLASTAMYIALYYWVDVDWWQQWRSTERVIQLIKWIVVGMFVYCSTLVLTGLRWHHLSDDCRI